MDAEWKLRQKESVYRKLYSELLKKHRGVLQHLGSELEPSSPSSSQSSSSQSSTSSSSSSSASYTTTAATTTNVFQDESQVLNQIFRTEIVNLLVGVGSTAATLATLRWGKIRFLSSPLVGKTTLVLHEAQAQARRHGTEELQSNTAFLVEGIFSLWVGFRCYDYASRQSQTTWKAMADLPLCQGRSRVADALCPDWVSTTHQQVPQAFWDAAADGKVRDPLAWNVIHTFSRNCEKRWAVEDRIRRERGLDREEPVALPSRVGFADADIETKDQVMEDL